MFNPIILIFNSISEDLILQEIAILVFHEFRSKSQLKVKSLL